MERAKVHHWLVVELEEEVCGQLQRYSNEEQQAIAEVVHCGHVSLHGSFVAWKQCLHAWSRVECVVW